MIDLTILTIVLPFSLKYMTDLTILTIAVTDLTILTVVHDFLVKVGEMFGVSGKGHAVARHRIPVS